MALLLSFAEEDAEKEEDEDEDEAEHLTRELLSCFVVVVVVVVAPTGARSTRAQDLAAIVYRAS